MNLSRRTTLKLSGLAALGAAGLSLPLGRTVNAGTPSLLSGKNTPKPFQNAFKRLDVLTPYKREVDAEGPVDYYDVTQKQSFASILPGGLQTPIMGYEGLVPARRIDVEQGTRIVMTMRNQLPATQPVVRHADQDLDAPARLGLAAAVRRLRQRHHRPAAEEVLPLPQLPAGPHALVPRPRRALHRAERLLRLGVAVPPARPPGARAAAAGRVRRGLDVDAT